MQPTALTNDGLDRLLAMRPRLGPERPYFLDYRQLTLENGKTIEQLPYDADVEAFMHTCYDEHLLIPFDWPTWIGGPGKQFTTPEGLATASFEDCRRILTVILRQDRFCQNSLIGAAQSGLIAALLDRLSDHRRDLGTSDGFPIGVRARAQGCLLGLLVGDALGAQVEFRSATSIAREFPVGVRTMTGGGPFNLIPGQITDDGEMALCLARSIARAGTFDPRTALESYAWWYNSRPFDIGRTTARALRPAAAALAEGSDLLASTAAAADPHSQANGALMRVAPIGILGWNQPLDLVAAWARQDAALTHPSRICQDANALFAVTIATCLRSAGDVNWVQEQIGPWLASADLDPAVLRAYGRDDLPARPDGDKAGWVLIALGNALRQLFGQKSYDEGLIDTIAFGGDTDTNAAIAGAVLGALQGVDSIPAAWRETVEGCRPMARVAGVVNPRPEPLWPGEAPSLAQTIAQKGLDR